MKFIISLLFVLPSASFAHCPLEVSIDSKNYCTSMEWLNGEKKIQGQVLPTDELSPQLALMGEVPQKWIYSKADFVFWEKGDASQTPQVLETLRIFPYMTMKNGHHHGASYNSTWSSSSLQLNSVVFQQMPGCWSLRWTTSENDSFETSDHLVNVLAYTNLTDDENIVMSDYCKESVDPAGGHQH